MSTKQLLIVVALTAVLSLTLAWVIERTQVRAFMTEFDDWWEERSGHNEQQRPPDGGGA